MTNEPPHDIVAEQSTIGAMLLSKTAVSAVSEILKPEHFYRPVHEYIFRAILSLNGNGEPIDPVTVARELEKMGWLRKVGGGPYLLTLTTNTPSPAGATSYATVVRDKWRQRQIIAAGQRCLEIGYTDATTSEEVDHLLAQVDSTIRELGEPSRSGIGWDDLITKWRTWQEEPHAGGIATPWDELNLWLHGGMQKGQMIIVGGRPGGGKSNLGLNMALQAAEDKHRVTVFSVEMDSMEVCSRLLAAGSWSKMGQIFSRRMDAETRERVEEYIDTSKGMALEIVDQAYLTVEQIVAHCRIARPDVIFVDYAQLLEASNTKVSREQQVAHITRTLKVAAKDLKMVVLVAAQLNRNPVAGREPVISDLRESGAAEQDADVVLLLHRNPDQEKEVRLIVGKNRNGPTGNIDLQFRGELARVG